MLCLNLWKIILWTIYFTLPLTRNTVLTIFFHCCKDYTVVIFLSFLFMPRNTKLLWLNCTVPGWTEISRLLMWINNSKTTTTEMYWVKLIKQQFTQFLDIIFPTENNKYNPRDQSVFLVSTHSYDIMHCTVWHTLLRSLSHSVCIFKVEIMWKSYVLFTY